MPVSAYQYGIEIPQNADMNTYKTPGKFVSVSSSVTSTLENSPFSNGGFRLEVRSMIDPNNGASIQQIAYPGNMNTFKQFAIRTFLNTAWDDWRYFSDDATVIKSSFEITKTESYTGDCNEITNSGLFDQVINPSATNSPGQYAYIIVYKATHFNMITQIAVPYNVDGTLKVRTRENGIWRDWRTL